MHAEHEQDGAVGLAAQHLGPPHAVGQAPAAGRCTSRMTTSDSTTRRRRSACARHPTERQRVRDDADDDLEGHEPDDQHERDRQVAAVRVGVTPCEW